MMDPELTQYKPGMCQEFAIPDLVSQETGSHGLAVLIVYNW